MNKIIQDRLNALKSELSEIKNCKIRKTVDFPVVADLMSRIDELETMQIKLARHKLGIRN